MSSRERRRPRNPGRGHGEVPGRSLRVLPSTPLPGAKRVGGLGPRSTRLVNTGSRSVCPFNAGSQCFVNRSSRRLTRTLPRLSSIPFNRAGDTPLAHAWRTSRTHTRASDNVCVSQCPRVDRDNRRPGTGPHGHSLGPEYPRGFLVPRGTTQTTGGKKDLEGLNRS